MSDGSAAGDPAALASSQKAAEMRPFDLAFDLNRRGVLAAAFAVASAALVRGARAGAAITFEGLYKSFGVLGYEFADGVRALAGQEVTMIGYMAPPLKPESTFFVLTREPLAICPFCQSDADWPLDIVVIYMDAATPLVSAGEKVAVTGRLAIGSWIDPETGFVSQIRIEKAQYHRA